MRWRLFWRGFVDGLAMAARITIPVALLVLLLALASCAPTARPDPCSLLRWIEVPEQDIDRMSDELAVQLRAHNETWLRECEP